MGVEPLPGSFLTFRCIPPESSFLFRWIFGILPKIHIAGNPFFKVAGSSGNLGNGWVGPVPATSCKVAGRNRATTTSNFIILHFLILVLYRPSTGLFFSCRLSFLPYGYNIHSFLFCVNTYNKKSYKISLFFLFLYTCTFL